MFCKSLQYEPRLPLTNNYKILVKVDNDSLLDKQSRKELDGLKKFLQKTKKEEYAEGINDVRQETNNIINKINGWLSFWLAILALVGGVLPIVISWKQEQDKNKNFDVLKKALEKENKENERKITDRIEYMNTIHKDLKDYKKKIDDDHKKEFNKRKLHETHINITNIISSFIAAKDNKLIEDSYERDLLRITLLNELYQEFDKITECIFLDGYQSDSKMILKTILIQFYSLYASLRITLLKAYKTKELEITLNAIKVAIEIVTEDKESKENIEKEIKNVKIEIERSNSLFYVNK